MACFVVPLVQAVATSIWRKAAGKAVKDPSSGVLIRNLPELEKMLWGGSVLLIVDHIINGEVTWRFPFFTALEVEGGWQVMLREMLTVGVPMSLVLTTVWIIYAFVRESRKSVKTT